MEETLQAECLGMLLQEIRDKSRDAQEKSDLLRRFLTEEDISLAQIESFHEENIHSEKDIEDKIDLVYHVRRAITSLKEENFSVKESEIFMKSLERIQASRVEMNYSTDILDYIIKVMIAIQELGTLKELNEINSHIELAKSCNFFSDIEIVLPHLDTRYIIILSEGAPDFSPNAILDYLSELKRMKDMKEGSNYSQYLESAAYNAIGLFDSSEWTMSQKNQAKRTIKSLEINDDEIEQFLKEEDEEESKDDIRVNQRSQIRFHRRPIKSNRTSKHSIYIWRGEIIRNSQVVAIKEYCCPNEAGIPPYAKEEAEILQNLASSPNHQVFVKFYGLYQEYVEEEGEEMPKYSYGIVMEYCHRNLHEEIKERRERGFEKYTEDELKTIVASLLDGFAYMHNHKYYHLDIKLNNLMRGNDRNIKIVDFNVAMKFDPEEDRSVITGSYEKRGTPGFMAPEIQTHMDTNKIENPMYNPQKADAFSLGISFLKLYNLDIDTHYNIPENEGLLCNEIKKIEYQWLSDLLSRMLQFNPEKRSTVIDALAFKPETQTNPRSAYNN